MATGAAYSEPTTRMIQVEFAILQGAMGAAGDIGKWHQLPYDGALGDKKMDNANTRIMHRLPLTLVPISRAVPDASASYHDTGA